MAWFRSVVSWLRGSPPVAPPRRTVRPVLEGLEDRRVPSRIPILNHVVVVVEENHAFQQVIGSPDAPYIHSLAQDPKGALFTQSFGITHPSQPNYLDLFSGSNQGVLDDATPATTFTALSGMARCRSFRESGTGVGQGVKCQAVEPWWLAVGQERLATCGLAE